MKTIKAISTLILDPRLGNEEGTFHFSRPTSLITYTTLALAILAPALASADGGTGMMGYGGGMETFMFTSSIVWTVVGILAAVWLWQNISKK
ncbi:MAG: hypothetical protein AAB770_00480 [Patescibacteria group bacterium]